jgi:hypothetical protein
MLQRWMAESLQENHKTGKKEKKVDYKLFFDQLAIA